MLILAGSVKNFGEGLTDGRIKIFRLEGAGRGAKNFFAYVPVGGGERKEQK